MQRRKQGECRCTGLAPIWQKKQQKLRNKVLTAQLTVGSRRRGSHLGIPEGRINPNQGKSILNRNDATRKYTLVRQIFDSKMQGTHILPSSYSVSFRARTAQCFLGPIQCMAHRSSYNRATALQKQRKMAIDMLRYGKHPIEVLEKVDGPPETLFWGVIDYLNAHGRMADAMQTFDWWKSHNGYRGSECEQYYVKFINMLGKAGIGNMANDLLEEMQSFGVQPTVSTLTAVVHAYAESGFYERADQMMKEMMKSHRVPTVATYTGLIHIYAKKSLYDQMARTFNNMKTVGCKPDAFTYRILVKAYARAGIVGKMERTYKEMLSEGWPPDSESLSLIIQTYATLGQFKDMEKYYSCFREFGIAVHESTVQAVALAYIKQSNFYQLGEFVRAVGFQYPNMGTFLWNCLLLSSAANFSTEDLQREYLNMKRSGFPPNLTTINIQVLAFARMQLFCHLHTTISHMHALEIAPDLVTYGAIVDAYLAAGLEEKLWNAVEKLKIADLTPEVKTDTIVFDAFKKGDFQAYCEDFITKVRLFGEPQISYSVLTDFYLKMQGKRKEEVPAM